VSASEDSLQPGGSGLRHWIYVSHLAPEVPSTAVAAILKVSRERNHALGITGALIFDGERFAQWLEGSPAAVQSLIDRIDADHRHAGLEVLHDGPFHGPRLAGQWLAGYADPALIDEWLQPQAPRGPAMVAAFTNALRDCDMSP
jgi:Sensors of blue-light using FAD